jgi:hypothetical protein
MRWNEWGAASATSLGVLVYTGMDRTTRVKVRVRLYRVVQGCGAHRSRPYYYADAGVTLENQTGTLQLAFNRY